MTKYNLICKYCLVHLGNTTSTSNGLVTKLSTCKKCAISQLGGKPVDSATTTTKDMRFSYAQAKNTQYRMSQAIKSLESEVCNLILNESSKARIIVMLAMISELADDDFQENYKL